MPKIKIEVSARHCHLSPKDLENLFGFGYKLKSLKPLSQKGQFAAKETVTIKTKDGQIENLRILGPVRENTQIELSMTDARKLKLNPPVRLSGEIKGTPGATLVGPKGAIKIKEGVIIAKRHIHCDLQTAKKFGFKNNQKLSVKTFGDRSIIFNETPIRIHKDFVFYMHVDTDEGNAALLGGVCNVGEIIKK